MMQNNEPKPVIKIFVSHRTDQVSETIDNPLYVNVRCGAVYDKRNPEEYGHMLGDDTGDNISEKKYKYSELTVQYWAWKNQEADYYGLCHYRRYFIFKKLENYYKRYQHEQIQCDYLNKENEKKLGLLNSDYMTQIISQYDLLADIEFDIRKVYTPKGTQGNVLNHWKAWEGVLIPSGTVEMVLSLIDKLYPEYYADAVQYLHGWKYRGYDLFIMKKFLFEKYCYFQYNVLAELEKTIDDTYFSENMTRVCAFMSEILHDVFIYHIVHSKKYRVKDLEVVYFKETKHQNNFSPAFLKNNIPIVLLSSEYYIPYVGVLLQSLKEYACKDYGYDVIILHKGINNELQNQLLRVTEDSNNISIRFFNAKSVVDDSEFYVSSQFYSVEAYYRILTPWILKSYDKAIVMDSDLVLNGDISDLYNQDVDDVCIAAAKDIVYMGFLNGFQPGVLEYTQKKMKMKRPYDYVNTGVMLMNLKRIREKCTGTDLVNFCRENHFNIQEQDGLNAFFEGEIKFIDLKWNYYVEVNPAIQYAINGWAPRKEKEHYMGMNPYGDNKPYIIHYASQPKPWNDPNVKYSEFWWRYAAKTEFYPLINFRMAQGSVNGALAFGRFSLARRVADKLLPKGSKRREALKKVMPRGSKQFELLKRMYHKFTF